MKIAGKIVFTENPALPLITMSQIYSETFKDIQETFHRLPVTFLRATPTCSAMMTMVSCIVLLPLKMKAWTLIKGVAIRMYHLLQWEEHQLGPNSLNHQPTLTKTCQAPPQKLNRHAQPHHQRPQEVAWVVSANSTKVPQRNFAILNIIKWLIMTNIPS